MILEELKNIISTPKTISLLSSYTTYEHELDLFIKLMFPNSIVCNSVKIKEILKFLSLIEDASIILENIYGNTQKNFYKELLKLCTSNNLNLIIKVLHYDIIQNIGRSFGQPSTTSALYSCSFYGNLNNGNLKVEKSRMLISNRDIKIGSLLKELRREKLHKISLQQQPQ